MQSNHLSNRISLMRLDAANQVVDINYPTIETALALIKDGCLACGKEQWHVVWNGSDLSGGEFQRYSHIIRLRVDNDITGGTQALKEKMGTDPLALAVFQTGEYQIDVLVKHEVNEILECSDAINFLSDYWLKKYVLASYPLVSEEPKSFNKNSIDQFPADTDLIVNLQSVVYRTPYDYCYSY